MSDSRRPDVLTRGDGVRGHTSWGDGRGRVAGRGRSLLRSVTAAVAVGLALACLGTSRSRAQEPDPGARGAPTAGAPAAGSPEPLSLRYRFTERYSLTEDPSQPDAVVQYQVGSRETVRLETEKPQGAPERAELSYHTIYTERPTKVGKLGEVSDAVRRYDSFRVTGARKADARTAGLLRHLNLDYRPRAGTVPLLISLTPDRPIRQEEYDFVLEQIFLPRLTTIMPRQPVRVADTWPITRQAAQALLGKLPEDGDFTLEGSLVEVRKAAEGTALTAIIEISGGLDLDKGKGAVRARISFEFEPPPAAAAADPKAASDRPGTTRRERDAGIVDAKGYITKVLMGRTHTIPLDDRGRLQQIGTRELVLQRRRVVGQAGVGETAALPVPETPPAADEMNSWLLFDDPNGRFHFRHPQELAIDVHQPDRIEMTYYRPGGGLDALLVLPVAKQEDSQRARLSRDPQAFVRELKDTWQKKGHELVNGASGWLPEADWAPLKRRVYRVETAIKPKQEALKERNVARFYLDAYLVLFDRNDCIRVEALTDRENHVVLRDQAEKLIRSLALGPSTPGPAAPGHLQPDRPSATRPSPTRPAAPTVPSAPGTP